MIQFKNKKVLIVVAHPDDETIGCGGLIAKLNKKKSKVFSIYLSDGRSARDKKKNNNTLVLKESAEAAKILGFKWLKDFCGKFEDQKLDKQSLLSIIKVIEKVKNKIKPDLIITHSKSDLNRDHRIVYEAVVTAFRPKHREIWSQILSFEIASATDYGNSLFEKKFDPNYFINIKQEWKKKEKALKAYKSEMLKFPNSRSIKGIKTLNQLRGVQNGIDMAEAFELVKFITR